MQLYTAWLEAAARPLCIQLHFTWEVLFYGLRVGPSARLRAKLFGGTKQYIDWQTAESLRSRTDRGGIEWLRPLLSKGEESPLVLNTVEPSVPQVPLWPGFVPRRCHLERI